MCKQIMAAGARWINMDILLTNRKCSSIHLESVPKYQEVGQKPAYTATPKNSKNIWPLSACVDCVGRPVSIFISD